MFKGILPIGRIQGVGAKELSIQYINYMKMVSLDPSNNLRRNVNSTMTVVTHSLNIDVDSSLGNAVLRNA